MQLTACFCHVTYLFHSESTLYSCLNVKSIFKSWYFLLKLSFICCYIICVTVPIKNGVHKTYLFKSNIKHYHSVYLPYLSVISNCLSRWESICSTILRNTLSLSTDVSLSHFLDITLFLDYLFQSENLNYTVYGTLRLHINIASFPSRHLPAQS